MVNRASSATAAGTQSAKPRPSGGACSHGRFRHNGRMWPPCGSLRARALALAPFRGSRACGGNGDVSYTQGQSPEPRTREYFYYVDHQGQVGREPGLGESGWARGWASPRGRGRMEVPAMGQGYKMGGAGAPQGRGRTNTCGLRA